jgi:phage terminase small subunit
MARIPSPGHLSTQQARFAHEYLKDLNATKAAIRAGYSTKSAASQAADLLKLPKISEEIGRLEAKRISAADVKADAVLRELQRIATFDCSQLFDERGQIRPPDTWSADVRACIAGLDVVRRTGTDGTIEQVFKLRFADKIAALRVLSAHLGLVQEVPGQGVQIFVGDGTVNGALPAVLCLPGDYAPAPVSLPAHHQP